MRLKNSGTDIYTKIGKYSSGPICTNHPLIKSIGSFCSFALGVDVVPNHQINAITTHSMISLGVHIEDILVEYQNYSVLSDFFDPDGKSPIREKCKQNRRIEIGNDVWLGRNVIITNGANIGNGVIAGAGSIITKDVPDYAIVAGTPARIIRFRYTEEQIRELNKICWWNWSDELISERYYDLYLDADSFIDKYRVDRI